MTQNIKKYPELATVVVNRQPVYPELARAIYNDSVYGPKVQRRWQRLLFEHQDGLAERGDHWYFGYLVSAFVKKNYGIENLLNFPSVTLELFYLCANQIDQTQED